jgi:copper chaperone CopZ
MKYLREQARCACEHRRIDGRGMSLLTLLLASSILITFAALNIGSYALAGSPAVAPSPANANFKRIVIAVEGMTCATCEIGVRYALKSVNGVESAVAAKLTDDAREIQGESCGEALKSFLSGKGWYRGADVDRLSEEEAGIIAARLIRRVEAKTPLPKDKAQELQHALAQSWSKCVTSGKHIATNRGGQRGCRLEDIADNIASRYLNQEQLKILKEAIESGVRPLPNES